MEDEECALSRNAEEHSYRKRWRTLWLDFKTSFNSFFRSNSTRSRKLSQNVVFVHKWVMLSAIVLVLLWFTLHMLVYSDNVKPMLPLPVKHGEHGIDLTAASLTADCERLLNDEDFVWYMEGFERMLLRGMPCICAPAYGLQLRYVCWRSESGGVVHAFNPFISGAPLRSSGRSLVTETQQALGLGTTDVKNTRFNAIKIQYTDIYCKDDTHIVQHQSSWCLQACLDLLDGISVYERAEKT